MYLLTDKNSLFWRGSIRVIFLLCQVSYLIKCDRYRCRFPQVIDKVLLFQNGRVMVSQKDLLEGRDRILRGRFVGRAGKFVERDEIELAVKTLQQTGKFFRVPGRIIYAGHEDLFECEHAPPRQGVIAAGIVGY